VIEAAFGCFEGSWSGQGVSRSNASYPPVHRLHFLNHVLLAPVLNWTRLPASPSPSSCQWTFVEVGFRTLMVGEGFRLPLWRCRDILFLDGAEVKTAQGMMSPAIAVNLPLKVVSFSVAGYFFVAMPRWRDFLRMSLVEERF